MLFEIHIADTLKGLKSLCGEMVLILSNLKFPWKVTDQKKPVR